jgi:hypothetical protein
MLKNKLMAFLVILLMLSLPLSNVYAVDPDSPEGQVQSIEASIRSTNIKDFENNTAFQNLSDEKKNVFRYFYFCTKDTAIATEVYGQACKIWSADDMNLYSQYITGNESCKKSIKDNGFFADRIGYLNKYVSDWQHLSDKEKVAFFNTDKHSITNAFKVLQNADTNEMMYINGNLCIQDNESITSTGYDAVNEAFTRINSVASKKVSAEDGKLFEDTCRGFVDDIYKYHHEYQVLNASVKANTTAAIQKVLEKNPNQVEVRKKLNDLKIKLHDIAETMNDMSTGAFASEVACTTTGAVLITAGIICIIVGCATGFNATVIMGGIGLITGGLFLLAMGTPYLADNIDIKALSGKMKKWVDDISPSIDYLIANLGNQTGA